MASVTRVATGTYRVEDDGRQHIVYVAGAGDERWAFLNGEVFHVLGEPAATHSNRVNRRAPGTAGTQSLTAPMPATIVKVLVAVGDHVKKGDTVIVAEAMKMELPIRAHADGLVAAVLCREGELVQPDQTLVELR